MLEDALAHYEYVKQQQLRNPLQYVADQMNIGRSTAHKYVKQAKEARK